MDSLCRVALDKGLYWVLGKGQIAIRMPIAVCNWIHFVG